MNKINKYYWYTSWKIDKSSPTQDKDNPKCKFKLIRKKVTMDYFKGTKQNG
mgnify:CR=1 FL=1|tara:strand:+ start:801 stop:953 length:153 start_codon:yes stop_codon:yes gene_type:complete